MVAGLQRSAKEGRDWFQITPWATAPESGEGRLAGVLEYIHGAKRVLGRKVERRKRELLQARGQKWKEGKPKIRLIVIEKRVGCKAPAGLRSLLFMYISIEDKKNN